MCFRRTHRQNKDVNDMILTYIFEYNLKKNLPSYITPITHITLTILI